MDAPTRQRLRGGFDRAATEYAAARPGYPVAAVDWLVGERPIDVLDLGAGSGALTRVLAARSHRVVAAEPSRNLLTETRLAVPDLPAVQAGAEALPFAPESFDAVTVATAFHWFDPARALPEIARVLRPGARLGLTWNTRTKDVPWARDLDTLLRSASESTLQGDWGTGSMRAVEESPEFAASEYAEFEHHQSLDRRAAVDLVASRSYVIALDQADRDALLARVGDLFSHHCDDSGRVVLPYRCQCWRVVRRP